MGHCILTGFIATGKTSVGKLVAATLRCPFYDLDAAIVLATGRAVAEIFANDGEAVFRALERTHLPRLLSAPTGVIATGGGTALDPQNVARMSAAGRVIALNAAPHLVWERLRAESPPTARPLLPAPFDAAQVARLWETRAPSYAQFPDQLDTSDVTPADVAACVVEMLRGVAA
ncbi:MAG: shikimate kinase [Deltaproteobacteria bacterium]|nr:shikimate kinase [Deltaproteobacteria bacterium]